MTSITLAKTLLTIPLKGNSVTRCLIYLLMDNTLFKTKFRIPLLDLQLQPPLLRLNLHLDPILIQHMKAAPHVAHHPNSNHSF